MLQERTSVQAVLATKVLIFPSEMRKVQQFTRGVAPDKSKTYVQVCLRSLFRLTAVGFPHGLELYVPVAVDEESIHY